jgi:hypothetical protein
MHLPLGTMALWFWRSGTMALLFGHRETGLATQATGLGTMETGLDTLETGLGHPETGLDTLETRCDNN